MTKAGWRRAGLAAGALVAVLAPAAAPAQAVSLHAGGRIWGASTAAMAAVRAELPLHEVFLVEVAGSVAHPREGEVRTASGVLEAQLQLAVPLGDVLTPYLGAGAGIARMHGRDGTEDGVERVVSVAAGVRARLSERLSLVLDARARGPVTAETYGSHTDVTAGLRVRLGRPGTAR
jgi:opacity protein-like surface antigen